MTRLKAHEFAALSEEIPCSTEQGILILEQGIEIPCFSFDQGTGPAYQNLRFRDFGRSSRVLRFRRLRSLFLRYSPFRSQVSDDRVCAKLPRSTLDVAAISSWLHLDTERRRVVSSTPKRLDNYERHAAIASLITSGCGHSGTRITITSASPDSNVGRCGRRMR